jgi:hypothetical protein
MGVVRFGTSSEFVSLAVQRASVGEGWLDIGVEIAVHGFRGAISVSAEEADLTEFLEQLRHMDATLHGAAELKPREEQLVLELVADGLGHIFLTGSAWSQARYENHLEFELNLDQTFLAEPIRELERSLQPRARHDV